MTQEALNDWIKWSSEKVRMEQEREKLIDLITSYFGVDPAYYGIEVAHLADFLIENGVVIPVRCKDCIYNETGGCEYSESADAGYRPDYFCADGERMGG